MPTDWNNESSVLTDSIVYIGLAQSLFAAFALATRVRKKPSDYILIVCLLTITFKFMAFAVDQIHGDYINMEFSVVLIPMTFGPFMYLYTDYLTNRKLVFNPKDLVHFLPFFLMTLVYFAFLRNVVEFRDVDYFKRDPFRWIRLLYGIILFITVVLYTVITFLKLRVYRRNLETNFSFWSNQLRLLWLNFIPLVFSVFFLLYFTMGILNAASVKMLVDVSSISHYGLTIIAFMVSYFGLRQPSLFHTNFLDFNEPREKSRAEKKHSKVPAKYSANEIAEQIAELNRIMTEDKPYLNSVLTLYDLADKVNLNKNDLTNLLNQHIGKNFFAYVNEFRVKEVIKRFERPTYDHYTIIAIAYDCGFNSKSTFNSLFKQYTQQTPSSYRNAIKR